MSVGDLMNSSDSSQEWKGMYSSRYAGYYGSFIRCSLIMSLCGVPFIGVYFIKHQFLCLRVFCCSPLVVGFLIFGFFLTSVYCFRLFMLFVGDAKGLS